MRETDESLLLAFAAHRDEAAIRQVAERYLGLIFHTALRRTGNRQMAEDVSQHILCAIARKAAPLARKPGLLPSWIHRATLYESSKAMRSELSQQKRRSHLAAGGDRHGTRLRTRQGGAGFPDPKRDRRRARALRRT